MKQLILLLLGLILLTGCSTEEESNMMPPTVETSEITIGATRSLPDSIAIALETSALLQDLTAYNDSVLATSIDPQISFSWFKKLVRIAKADLYGFAGGMILGSALTGNAVVGATVGVISGATSSVIAAKSSVPNQVVKKLPALYNAQFESFDRYTYASRNNQNYSRRAQVEAAAIGDMTEFWRFTTHLAPGIDHNLVVDQFRNTADLTASDIQYALSSQYRPLIYAENIQALLDNDTYNARLDNHDWIYIFSDRINMKTTISQAKAGTIAAEFEKLVADSNASVSEVKTHTLTYLTKIYASQEIEKSEKEALYKILPLYMYSLSYWSRNLVEE
ncbi:MAG: hypothetical protein K2O78_01585 [Muribaculaceae bacterium]|nr:hypothetical protein [Muribaculaceae bacterium]MDE7080335.1 hypothetical protein [Muribaculaceae bacterium]